MRKIGIFVLGIIGVVVFIFLFEIKINSKEGYNNLEKLRAVHIGMDSSDVLRIMGRPQSIEDKGKSEGIYYDYEVPSGLSTYCIIIIDSSGHVRNIHPSSKELDDLIGGNVSQ